MKMLPALLLASLFAFAAPSWGHGGMPDVPEIASASEAGAGCEKCRHGEMDGKRARCQHDGMGGMGQGDKQAQGCCGGMAGASCCGGAKGGDAALERRIEALEKRLDLMQQLLLQSASRPGSQ